MSSWFPTFHEQESLVNGYIRQNYPQWIPIMLIKIIVSFYNEIFYWTLTKEKLKKFVASPEGKSLIGGKFHIQNMEFQQIFFYTDKLVHYGVDVVKLDKNIDFVVLQTRLYNLEHDVLHLCTEKRCVESKQGFPIMTLTDCKNINKVTLCGHVKLLRIQPKNINNNKLLYHQTGIKMKKQIHFEWKFDIKTLNKMKLYLSNEEHKRKYFCVYSTYFDENNWISRLCRQINDEQFYFELFLLKLPKNIKKIYIEYRMKLIADNENVLTDLTELVNWDFNDIDNAFYCRLSDTKLLSIDQSLTAFIDITIQKIMDFNDEEILPQNWLKHNVI